MNFVLKNNLFRYLEVNLDKTKIRDFEKSVQKYVDVNNDCLSENSPISRLYFYDKDRQLIYDLLNIKESYLKELITKLPTNSSWKVLNDPFNILMTLIIRDLTIKKNKKATELAVLYLSFSLYASLHFKYFRFIPNGNIMEYTINNLNNKFLIKKYGILIKAIFHTAMASHEKYCKSLINGSDEDILNYIMNLRIRLNNFLKNISIEYYKNQKSGSYLNTEKDDFSKDNFYETDSVSLTISKITEKVANNFFTTSLNNKLINLSANLSKCDSFTLKNTLLNMKDTESDKVKELISNLLQLFLDSNNSDEISSKKFLLFFINAYSKSNTKDKRLLIIKNLLDYFLTNNCKKYNQTEREATKNNYRKAIYLYFAMLIQVNQTYH